MTDDEFVQYLIENGFAEEYSGYGHASAREIADHLYKLGFVVTLEDES